MGNTITKSFSVIFFVVLKVMSFSQSPSNVTEADFALNGCGDLREIVIKAMENLQGEVRC